MNFGVILPHTKLYGGVKRFLELGNIFIAKKHSFTVFTMFGDSPDWFKFNGTVKTYDALDAVELDVLFFTEPRYIKLVQNAKVKKRIFYHVREGENLNPILKYNNIDIFVCSSNIYNYDCRKYKIKPFKAIGAIDLSKYVIKDISKREINAENRILIYGRLAEGRKGTKFVVKACERIYRKHKNIKLILFDTPVDEKMKRLDESFSCKVPFEFILNHPFNRNVELFHKADIFVSAEKRAGWANTVAEAMACGIPVIATESGTKDMIIDGETGLICRRNSYDIARKINLLLGNISLHEKLGKNGRKQIEMFSWDKLADKIISELKG